MCDRPPFSAYRSSSQGRLRVWFGLLPSILAMSVLGGCDMRGSGGWREESTRLGPRIVQLGQPVPKGGGRYKLGEPYRVNGKVYVPREYRNYDQTGLASWYGELFHGRRTANGEIYDMEALTAAHPTLPIPSYVRVTNLYNGRSLVVRVNDRGPYAHGRLIDLSWATAALLQIERPGVAKVRVQYLGDAPMNGDDSYERRVLASQPWAGPRIASARSPAKAMRSRGETPTDYAHNRRDTMPETAEMASAVPTPGMGTKRPVAAASFSPEAAPAAPISAAAAQAPRFARAAPRPSEQVAIKRARVEPKILRDRLEPQSDTIASAKVPAAQSRPARHTAATPTSRAEQGPPEPSYIPFREASDPPPQPDRTKPDRRLAISRPAAAKPAAQRRQPAGASAPYLGAKAAAPAYYVEAGVFPERPIAERLAAVLKDIAPTSIEDVTHEGRPAHRIRLGPFAEGEAASAAAERMRAAGLTGARLAGGT